MVFQLPDNREEFIEQVIDRIKKSYPDVKEEDIEELTLDCIIRCEDYMNREIIGRLFFSVVKVIKTQMQRQIDDSTGDTKQITAASDNGQSVSLEDKKYFKNELENDLFDSIIPQLNSYRKIRT